MEEEEDHEPSILLLKVNIEKFGFFISKFISYKLFDFGWICSIFKLWLRLMVQKVFVNYLHRFSNLLTWCALGTRAWILDPSLTNLHKFVKILPWKLHFVHKFANNESKIQARASNARQNKSYDKLKRWRCYLHHQPWS